MKKCILLKTHYQINHRYLNSILFLTFSLCFPRIASSNKWTPPRENQPTIKFGVTSSSISESFQDKNDKSIPSVNYVPNSLGRFLVGVSYLGYGLSVGFTGSNENEKSIADKGSTRGEDYQFRFFKEENAFELFYQKYQGFYIQNSSSIDSTFDDTGSYIQRADLRSIHYGLQYIRSINPEDLSLAACFEQSGWQNESGGTWFLYGAFDFHHLDADSPIIPSQLRDRYDGIKDFQKGDFSSLKIGGGGAYALVYDKLFLATQLVIAAGQQKQDYELGERGISKILPTLGTHFKISTGYNGDSYFTSINVFLDSTQFSIADTQVTISSTDATILFGKHF